MLVKITLYIILTVLMIGFLLFVSQVIYLGINEFFNGGNKKTNKKETNK